MKSALSEFCDARGISANIKNAFGAYLRSTYAQKYLLAGEGETVHLMINRLTEEQLEQAWQEFVKDLASYLR